jgi:hypothetical protein
MYLLFIMLKYVFLSKGRRNFENGKVVPVLNEAHCREAQEQIWQRGRLYGFTVTTWLSLPTFLWLDDQRGL